MLDICVLAILFTVAVFGAPLLLFILGAANVAGNESEQERRRGE